MIDYLLSQLAPHLCSGCGKTGTLLCDNCKYDIENDYFDGCIACGKVYSMCSGCSACGLPYSRAWCIGERSGALRLLIDNYKFENVHAAHRTLAKLFDSRLGQLPKETVIIPVPTVAGHIRERGYDHTLLMAKALGKRRHLKVSQALRRVTSTRQRDASRATRIAQAERAFAVKGKLDDTRSYLLIDDIITTGATVKYAAQALREAGAGDVWVAVIARQPLD